MRSLIRIAGLCLLVLSMQAGAASPFTEGVDYQRIVPPVPTHVEQGKVEVAELFWYGCPHCYRFEPYLEHWLQKDKPDVVQFKHIPSTLNPGWRPQARAYYALKELGKAEQMHDKFFNAIHAQGRRLNDKQSMARFFASQGIAKQDFLDAYESLAVETRVRRATELAKAYGATGVPTMVVAGKYRTSASLARSYPKMLKIVDYLVQREAGRQQAKAQTH